MWLAMVGRRSLAGRRARARARRRPASRAPGGPRSAGRRRGAARRSTAARPFSDSISRGRTPGRRRPGRTATRAASASSGAVVVRPRARRSGCGTSSVLVADELGLEAGVELRSAVKPTAAVRARARSRCSSISRANPASSTSLPCSAAISCGQLEREAVGVVELEGVVGRDRRPPTGPARRRAACRRSRACCANRASSLPARGGPRRGGRRDRGRRSPSRSTTCSCSRRQERLGRGRSGGRATTARRITRRST